MYCELWNFEYTYIVLTQSKYEKACVGTLRLVLHKNKRIKSLTFSNFVKEMFESF